MVLVWQITRDSPNSPNFLPAKHSRNTVFRLTASQPAVRPGCARCRALKITQNNRLLRRIYETVVPKTIFLLRHRGSFVLPYITFFSIDWNVGMRKQFQRDHNIPYKV